jgi:hypothetical protein
MPDAVMRLAKSGARRVVGGDGHLAVAEPMPTVFAQLPAMPTAGTISLADRAGFDLRPVGQGSEGHEVYLSIFAISPLVQQSRELAGEVCMQLLARCKAVLGSTTGRAGSTVLDSSWRYCKSVQIVARSAELNRLEAQYGAMIVATTGNEDGAAVGCRDIGNATDIFVSFGLVDPDSGGGTAATAADAIVATGT